MPTCIVIKTVFIAKRKQNEENGMIYLKRDLKKKKKKKKKTAMIELLVSCFLVGYRKQ